MFGEISGRLLCLNAILNRNEKLRHVRVVDGLKALTQWYGPHRFIMSHRLKKTRINSQFEWIGLGSYGVAWPAHWPLHRLVYSLVELQASSNSHYYFAFGTRIKEGDCVIDIGATEGSFALESLLKYNAGHVWCFEPDKTMTSALELTIERNNLQGRMHVVSMAATDGIREVRFVVNSEDPLSSHCVELSSLSARPDLLSLEQAVSGISLDEWADQGAIGRIDFIKIDAEGSDLDVLRGAERCLKKWRPSIAVTTYHHPDHCNKIVDFLESLNLGYRFKAKGIVSFDSIPRPVMLHAVYPDRHNQR